MNARNYRHGHKPADGWSPEWASYYNMRARCLNKKHPSFARYGGRGITVCDRWLHGEGGLSGFQCFLADMGPKPAPGREWQVERIENGRGYEPDNCRWATATEQANNRRSSRFLTVFGEIWTLAVWSRLARLPLTTLHARLTAGWEPERAVTEPLRGKPSPRPYGLPHHGVWDGSIA